MSGVGERPDPVRAVSTGRYHGTQRHRYRRQTRANTERLVCWLSSHVRPHKFLNRSIALVSWDEACRGTRGRRRDRASSVFYRSLQALGSRAGCGCCSARRGATPSRRWRSSTSSSRCPTRPPGAGATIRGTQQPATHSGARTGSINRPKQRLEEFCVPESSFSCSRSQKACSEIKTADTMEAQQCNASQTSEKFRQDSAQNPRLGSCAW